MLLLTSVASISSAISSISSRETRLTNLRKSFTIVLRIGGLALGYEYASNSYLLGVSISLVGNLSSA